MSLVSKSAQPLVPPPLPSRLHKSVAQTNESGDGRAIVRARVRAGVGLELRVSRGSSRKISSKTFFGVNCVLNHPKSIPEKKFFENFQNFQKMAAAPNWIGELGVKFLSAIS